jgi:hypothetical protein
VDAMANETIDCYMRGIYARRAYYGERRAAA